MEVQGSGSGGRVSVPCPRPRGSALQVALSNARSEAGQRRREALYNLGVIADDEGRSAVQPERRQEGFDRWKVGLWFSYYRRRRCRGIRLSVVGLGRQGPASDARWNRNGI